MKQAIGSLSPLLSPYYSITAVNDSSLFVNQPWQASTQLLVIPGGRDLPYCEKLNGEPNRAIASWVRQGGKYLGLCAGAYFASARVEFEVQDKRMSVVGSRELAFFPGVARGCAFPGFIYESVQGARLANVAGVGSKEAKVFWNGGGVFVDAEHCDGVKVLARYTERLAVQGGDVAAVQCLVGKGVAVLSAVHPEYVKLWIIPFD